MKLLLSIADWIDTCNEWVGKVIQWAIVLLVIVFIIESILRKGIFGPPDMVYRNIILYLRLLYLVWIGIYLSAQRSCSNRPRI